MNYDKYKNRLIEYLRLKGIKAERGLIRCFNPNHEDKNPSCELFDDKFICYSGNCGIHGDIYDAVEILEGIKDKSEQFKAVEKTFGDDYVPPPEIKTEKQTFTPDTKACEEFEKYLSKNKASKKSNNKFLKYKSYFKRWSWYSKKYILPFRYNRQLGKAFFLLARLRPRTGRTG